MFERSEVVFKILCAGAGVLVLWQVVRAVQRSDPLAGASIPALPSLPASTNTQAEAKGTNALPAMMNPGPFPGMPGQGPPLPPEVQGRLDRIIESEILAPVMRPQPVALLGIVGRDAFLQAPNGQSGSIKEGEELGGIKLLKLGINRALIEEAGEKKELTLFSGLGSESLMSIQTNSSQ
jgi:hypothetical protein